jgi:hypothetical protein
MVEDFKDNYVTGWIRVYRSLKNHWLWTKGKPLTRLEAWLLILIEANHEDEKCLINGNLIECKRGQKLYSLETWSKKFFWSVQSVRTFFKILEKDNMIITEGLQKTTRLTICNYAIYNDNQQATNKQPTSNQQATNKQLTTIKELKNDNNDKELKNYKNTLLSEIDSDKYKNLKHDHIEIAKAFQKLFIKNQNDSGIKNSKIENAKGTWVDDIRLLLEVDQKTTEDCKTVFKFLKEDEFWKPNILSAKKLREKFDILLMKSKSNTKNGNRNSTTEKLSQRMENIIRESEKH